MHRSKKNVYVTQQLNWFCQKGLVVWQLQVNFFIFVVHIVPVTVPDNIQLVWINLGGYTYFFSSNLFCLLSARFFSFESVFPISGSCGISTTVSVSILGEIFGFVSRTWWSHIFDFSFRNEVFFLQCSNWSWLRKRKNDKEWTVAIIFLRTIQMALLVKALSYEEFISVHS